VTADPAAYVSRAGLKLAHGLDHLGVTVTSLLCADLGCNVGGFTDCLLQRGAARVYAVDTGYGVLAHRLRQDRRVVVMERTNALHAPPPEAVDLVVVDLGWTPQRHAVPAALRWLKPSGRLLSLVKPHYEVTSAAGRERLVRGRLDSAEAGRVLEGVLSSMGDLGAVVLGRCQSPLTGRKSGRRGGTGNVEFLVLARPAP
jgi:23S rRNA (cytidine1920-2'-O)/16S rRNA (cytidine1409-2'-O)-methyltransferase